MTSSTLNDKLKDFDFSGGEYYIFTNKYNISEGNELELLDNDSDAAASCVKELGLSYEINSRHYSIVVDGDHITDMVEVGWEFWKTK